ncbi:glycosyltransferase family 4 protein [Microbacterium hatanonis]|nr:glycosyltransferase family 4 protein [Microbacterium hatanonis]
MYGGPFDTASRQSELARQSGFDVVLIAGSFDGDEPDAKKNRVTAKVRHVFGMSSFVDVYSFQVFIRLTQAIRAADILHISISREMLPLTAMVLGRLFRKGLVLQPHGMLTSRASNFHRLFDSVLLKPWLGKRSSFVALTANEATELERWNDRLRDRITIMGNPPPMGLERLQDGRATNRSALFAARLHPRKKVMDFAAAAATAEKHGWDESYDVLGPDEGDLENLLEVAAAVGNLNYLGATSSEGVLRQLRNTGVFVLSSSNEPWGNVLVASFRLGVPVVLTRSSVLASVVSEYEAGIVVDDGDGQAMAEAVHLILDKSNYALFSQRSALLGESLFSETSAKHNLEKLYEAVAQSRGSS